MVEVTFLVGNAEKHRIRIHYESMLSGRLRIFVDGKERATSSVWVKKREMTLKVGRKEKHEVKIEVGGTMTATIDAFVDGEPVLKIA